ncbi:MAG: monovalent cation/H(+) antiporter subunit G [Clostridiales bacterium]|nr:monovalent cation/H(+) antiporter subunit G [Clostridiales bacterium]
MIDMIRLIACILLTAAGLCCLVSGVVGVFRFKYALNRLHAAAILDTVGILLMLLGVIVATGFTLTSAKLLVVIAFLWLTSPVAGHLIGRMEITINDDLDKSMAVIDRETVEHEKDADIPTDEKEAN